MQVPLPESERILEDILRRPGDLKDKDTGRGDGAQSGSSTAGQTYRDSPLADYTAVPEQIETQGEEEMSATSNLADLQRRLHLSRLFPDSVAVTGGTLDFDRAIEIIKERYLELISENY